MDGERSPGEPDDDATDEPEEPSAAPDADQPPEESDPESTEPEPGDAGSTADPAPSDDGVDDKEESQDGDDSDADEQAVEEESGDSGEGQSTQDEPDDQVETQDADDTDADEPTPDADEQEVEEESTEPDEDQASEDEPDVESDDGDEEASEDDGDQDDDYTPTSIDDDYEVEVPPYAQVSGPSEDQEMPLAEHIEEMLKRLAVIIAIAGIVSLVTFPIAEELINFLWNSILPEGEITRPRLYGILELKLTELKVASLAGLIVALPVLVHQTYQFMRPGLYPHERRYYLAAIPTSLVLALVGVSFAYFIVLPAIFTYFLYYSQDVATIGFALGRTFDLILILMGYLAIVFQIPLFIMLAMMMGLVTRQWLADRRILFWGGFLGISFIFSPDPTGMAPIVVALTMVVLFEGTLLLTKWTSGRSSTADS